MVDLRVLALGAMALLIATHGASTAVSSSSQSRAPVIGAQQSGVHASLVAASDRDMIGPVDPVVYRP